MVYTLERSHTANDHWQNDPNGKTGMIKLVQSSSVYVGQQIEIYPMNRMILWLLLQSVRFA